MVETIHNKYLVESLICFDTHRYLLLKRAKLERQWRNIFADWAIIWEGDDDHVCAAGLEIREYELFYGIADALMPFLDKVLETG